MAGDDHESSDMNAQLYFHGIKLALGAGGIVLLIRAREGRGTIRCPGATTDTKIDGHPRHTRRTHMLKCDGASKVSSLKLPASSRKHDESVSPEMLQATLWKLRSTSSPSHRRRGAAPTSADSDARGVCNYSFSCCLP